MTIKIEQEAIIRVLNTERSSPTQHPNDDDPRKNVSISGTVAAEPPSLPPCRVSDDVAVDRTTVQHILKPTVDKFSDDICPDLLSLDSDDDDCLSISSCSSASSCGGGSQERKVTFASLLVTEVNTRPRTPESDKGLLFYTEKETTRFRLEYRQERKALAENDNHVHNVNLSSSNLEPPTCEGSSRHRISRVVVEHNNSHETFYDFTSFAYSLQTEGEDSVGDVFFDNDSFWSGSITWY